jgi:ribosomal-protein-alanine N-acetyltransferase
MTQPIIRARTDADLDACVAELAEVHRTDGYPTRWPSDPADWLTPSGMLAAWVAVNADDDGILGHVVLERLSSAKLSDMVRAAAGVPDDRIGYVGRLFTAVSARGRGVGRLLFEPLLSTAKELGLRPALDVLADAGPAIALYERLGWQRIGTEQALWRNQAGVHPVVHHYLCPV